MTFKEEMSGQGGVEYRGYIEEGISGRTRRRGERYDTHRTTEESRGG